MTESCCEANNTNAVSVVQCFGPNHTLLGLIVALLSAIVMSVNEMLSALINIKPPPSAACRKQQQSPRRQQNKGPMICESASMSSQAHRGRQTRRYVTATAWHEAFRITAAMVNPSAHSGHPPCCL